MDAASAQPRRDEHTHNLMTMDDDKPIHPIQKLMDNPWLLLALGLLVPILSYTVWAWIELANVPVAK